MVLFYISLVTDKNYIEIDIIIGFRQFGSCSVPSLARMHSLHFLLELEETVHESLGSWRTARNVNIHGNNSVAASDHGVTVVIVASTVRTTTHTDDPSGLGHLVITLPEGRSHLICQSSSNNDDICLSWRCSEHNTISVHIISWGSNVHHLYGTTGQTKSERPQRTLSSPID